MKFEHSSIQRSGDADEVGVEQAEPEGHEQPADEPEPHDDGELGPAGQLEVVVDRRHAEDPAVEPPERDHLNHDRQRLEDEQPTHDREEQLGAGEEGEAGEAAAEGQRPGIAHEDAGRGGVPPQESGAGAEHRRRHHGGVDRLVGIDAVDGHVAALPEGDDDEGGGHEGGRPGGEAVEAVGQVHGVGRGDDDEDGPDPPAPPAEVDTEVPGERQLGRDPDPVDAQHGEGAGHHQLAGRLRPLVEAEVPLEPDAEVVVDEADEGAADDEGHQADAAALEALAPRPQVADDVAGHRRPPDGQAAHRRGAGLGGVAARPVLPDELADVAGPQHPDEQRRPDQRQDEGGRRRQQQRVHAAPSPQWRRASATRSRPATRLALTSTASPTRSRGAMAVTAASGPSTITTSTPDSRAPSASDVAPTATSVSTPTAATSLPRRRCSSSAWGPSSAIGPRTAKRRPPAPAREARASRAAAIEVGLAL